MICKYEHDGDCCNSGATQYMCKCKLPCNTVEPLTNAERIRRMNDTELAKILDNFCDNAEDCEKCLLYTIGFLTIIQI